MRMKKSLLMMMEILFLLSVSIASAQEISKLEINKNTFSPGERIIVTTTIENPTNLNLFLQSLLSHSEQKTPPLLKSFEIKPLESGEVTLYNFSVDETFRNGEYSVSVRLVNAERPSEIIDSKELSFSVINALKEFSFEVLICKDRSCTEKSKIFVKGEKAYFDYASDIPDLKISGSLILPDGSTND
ncbi:MAG: hypothetical protein ACTSYH_07715, partial [Candidatus Heimdallarchaeaceae archaeon]